MPDYRCLVSDSTGKTKWIIVTAPDEQKALHEASGSGLTPVSVETIPEKGRKSVNSGKTKRAVLDFTEMMNILTESGLSVKDSLAIAASIGSKTDAGQIASRLQESVRKGVGFAQAINAQNGYFTDMYRGMISVGDRTGSIERIFPRLAAYLRSRKALEDRIAGALSYPIMVVSVVLLGSIALAVLVIPKLEIIFEGFGANESAQVSSNIRFMGLALFCGIAGVMLVGITMLIMRLIARESKDFALYIDRIKLGIPILGKFIRSLETMNFAFAMETLTDGGVSIESAIDEAACVVSNAAYREALLSVRDGLMKGDGLTGTFSAHPEFPPYMGQWMAIGERSGKPERAFAQIRLYFQAEIERAMSKIMTLVEPTLIVVIGVMILALVLGVVLPLFSMYGSIL